MEPFVDDAGAGAAARGVPDARSDAVPPARGSSPLARAARVATGLAVSAVALWATFRGRDLGAVLRVGLALDVRLIAPYAALLLAAHLARTWRWGLLLPRATGLTFRDLNAASAVGQMVQFILPLRVGEAARPVLISRGGAIPFVGAVSSVVAERVVDGISVGLGLLCLLVLVPPGPHVALARAAGATITAGFVAALAVLAAARRNRAAFGRTASAFAGRLGPRAAARARAFVEAFVAALDAPTSRGRIAGILALTAAYWGLAAATVAVVGRAYGLAMGPVPAALVVATNVVGLMLPSGPGMIGTSQACTLAALSLSDPGLLADARSVAFANALWAGQVVFQLALGLLFMPSVSRPLAGEPRHARARAAGEGAGARGGPGRLRRALRRALAGWPHWCRVVMDRDIAAFIGGLPRDAAALEVSGSAHARWGFRSYRSLQYPAFDLCAPPPELPTADLVVCEQVLEHVADPQRAARTLRDMLRPGGRLVVSVPFLIRIHREPADNWRFAPEGLRLLLERAGLEVVRLRSWGNAPCLLANRFFWFPYVPLLCPLHDAPDVPLVVWAIARRPDGVEPEAR